MCSDSVSSSRSVRYVVTQCPINLSLILSEELPYLTYASTQESQRDNIQGIKNNIPSEATYTLNPIRDFNVRVLVVSLL
jgi:hypothetical protein